ncbi:ubiquitin-hydrolase Zn-finger-containing protein [Saccharothrix texasensis]|uniref:Ubiquitin-hydrolase Zn-finger-containing protein n=2 Tax=Pseudonocardiaceae TaxID=2070 RepID=A0A3N1HAJ8_9PSEU|nr:ubiquitin-hydrolase Zn-finger-containing protein [Saccharothrix texasensis]
MMTGMTCPHVPELPEAVTPDNPEGCADCLAADEHNWAHLRICLSCGHVACCDSSPRRHATAHFHASEHPVMRSFEPEEDWRWCYVDARIV